MIEVDIVEGASDRLIADWIGQALARALGAGAGAGNGAGAVRIALPGGSTPFPILALLVERDLDWSRLVIVPTDDRDVPEDHEASNTGKLRALFEPLGARVVTLREQPGPGDTFTLVWLGMGADGHVASLFPNTDPRIDDPRGLRRVTPDPLPPEAPYDRLTLTLPALLDTEELILVMRGDDKRAVFDAALRGENDLPIARLLRANAGGARRPVTCFT